MRRASPPRVEAPGRGGAELIYVDGLVAVSRTVAVIRGMTFPIHRIASVRVAARRRNLGFVVVSAICGGAGYLAIHQDADVAGVWLFSLSATLAMIAYASRPHYSLLLRTAGGEVAAFSSADGEYVAHLRSCIQAAIAGRG
jgi:hypothetical protein